MRIDDQGWSKLEHRLSTAEAGPPIAIYLLVHTLSGGAEIQGSWADSTSDDDTTTWRNWAITDTSLIHTNVSFAEPNWDGPTEDYYNREADYRYARPEPRKPVDATVHQAWVQRLDAISGLSVDGIGNLVGGGTTRSWYAVGDLTLHFADGTTTTVPGQTNVPPQDRETSDRFIATLRQRLTL